MADDFFDRELLILDGDDCTIGIESTVVKVDDAGNIHLLRHGAITERELHELLMTMPGAVTMRSKIPGQSAQKIEAPGQYLKHYAPNIPAWTLCTKARPQVGLPRFPLAQCACVDFAGRMKEWQQHFQSYCDLSPSGDPLAAAQRLFIELRALETQNLATLLLLPQLDPHEPAQQALYDRIYRACEGRLGYFADGEVILSSPQ